ncbi:MAG: GIY-YIG nuclease family protein [Anderseniella sp.]|nr:GIY-YIG nuclease family protein [Anderseniella sp.]
MQPAVYILANRKHGTLYVGVTSKLAARVFQHRNNEVEGFTSKYGVHRLVWAETHDTMETAITREKQIKKWNRAWKVQLIEQENPEWDDLYNRLNG